MQSFQVGSIPDVVVDCRRMFSCVKDAPESMEALMDNMFVSQKIICERDIIKTNDNGVNYFIARKHIP